jgi:hypothetical protein
MTRLFKFIEGPMIGLYNCLSFILCCLIVDFPLGSTVRSSILAEGGWCMCMGESRVLIR